MTTVADRREIPRYSVSEVSHYLRIPEKTLSSWLFGRQYTISGALRISPPVIAPADPTGSRLSFCNLVEAHILESTRDRDEVPMSAVRDALDCVSRNTHAPLNLPGTLSTAAHCDQSRFAMTIAPFLSYLR